MTTLSDDEPADFVDGTRRACDHHGCPSATLSCATAGAPSAPE